MGETLAAHDFFLQPAKVAVGAALAEAERATSAEVVVTVRRESGSYAAADATVGLLSALALLSVFLYYPEPFDYTYLPLELIAAFALGSLVSSRVGGARRWLTPSRAREENVRRAAKAAFFDLGVGRAEARTGVLIYLAALERRVEVVSDVGIDPARLGPGWDEVQRKLDRAFRLDADVELFAGALRELCAVLSRAYPAPGAADEEEDAEAPSSEPGDAGDDEQPEDARGSEVP